MRKKDEEKMDNNCQIVQDILPLYVDEVCSEESKKLVEGHVTGCADCAAVLRKLKNTDCETSLATERMEVVQNHAKKEKRKSFTVGMVFAGILMIPVIVCMIVNLATGHGLSWFFIVLTALMVFASLVVVPLVAYRNKGLWTLGCFTASLLIMLATICIYTKGHWFFVVAFSVLFGLAIFFMPAVACAIKTGFWSKNRALLVIGTDTLLFALMMFSIGIMVKSPSYGVISGAISIVFVVFIWVILLISKYLKINKPIKAGLIVFWCGFFVAAAENIIYTLLGYSVTWNAFHPFNWSGYAVSNMKWIIFGACAIVGIALVIVGLTNKEQVMGTTAENQIEMK